MPSPSWIAGALAFAAGGICLLWAGVVVVRSRLARRWPSVRGQVVGTDVVQEGGAWTDVSYSPLLIYRYTVEGRPYSGTRRRFGPEMAWHAHSQARSEVEGYRKGGAVLVHYHPRDPAQSVVDPDDLGGTAVPVMFAVIAFVIGAWFFYG